MESQNGWCSSYLTSFLGKVREWLFLNSQQMSNRISWNLSGSHIYMPEPIPGSQEIQYTDWPSFDYMLSLPCAGQEPHPSPIHGEPQRGASLNGPGGRWGMDAARKADIRWMDALLSPCSSPPPQPACPWKEAAPCSHVWLGGRNANSPN